MGSETLELIDAVSEIEEIDNKKTFKLDNFEGPLDLLLRLIKDAKLDIKTVKLSEITGQYLQELSKMENLDMNDACGFIEIATTLIEIKSKSLLPREDEEEEIEIPEEVLLKLRLEEYKLLKDAGEKMQEIEDINKFYKKPDETVGDYRYVLKQMTMDALMDAFVKMLQHVDIKENTIKPRVIVKDRFTVEEKMTTIKDYVRTKKEVVFNELFDSDYSKIEVITCFMALLELLKLQLIEVTQDETYAEIHIKNGGELNEQFA